MRVSLPYLEVICPSISGDLSRNSISDLIWDCLQLIPVIPKRIIVILKFRFAPAQTTFESVDMRE